MTPFDIRETIANDNLNKLTNRLIDIETEIELEIIRLLAENNFTELTFNLPVPIIVVGANVKYITDIKIVGTCEIAFRFDDSKNFVTCDDYIETTNFFRFPYMEILIETNNTIGYIRD